MHVNQHAAFQPRPGFRLRSNLPGLKDDVAVGQDRGDALLSGNARLLAAHWDRADSGTGSSMNQALIASSLRIVRILESIALQRAEIIDVAELAREALQDREVPIAALGAELAFRDARAGPKGCDRCRAACCRRRRGRPYSRSCDRRLTTETQRAQRNAQSFLDLLSVALCVLCG